MEPERIESRQNPRVKNLVRLRERTHRRRQGLFLVEGVRELSRAIVTGAPIEEFFICSELIRSEEARKLLLTISELDLPISDLAQPAFEKVSYRESPDGIMATLQQWPACLEDLELPANPLVVVLEALEKPGNLGAILRTMDAAGADALILADAVVDLFNPNVIRASQGAIFSVPFAQASTAETIDFIRDKGITPFATTPAASGSLWDAQLSKPAAIIMGSEAHGLSDQWLENEGVSKILIPMAEGCTDSLNVSTSTAICLFEAVRQRACCNYVLF